jgi:hypothetical protein
MNKKTFGYILLLGSAWGLAECGLGAGLKACASSISGSVMTAAALFFVAAAWAAGRKAANVALLVAVAIGFKMFDALLLGVPLRSGAIVHPAFAFVLEGAGFLVVGALLMRSRKQSSSRGEAGAIRSRFGTTAPKLEVKDAHFPLLRKSNPGRGILWGGTSALIAAAAFPLVKFATGIPACVVAGSAIPMVWAYAPLAVGLSMLTVPLGFKTAERARAFAAGPAWQIPAAVVISLAIMTVIRGFI